MCYYSFSKYLKERFGTRVRRISLNAGFGCPNKDGTLSSEGCIFCNERGFSPFAQTSLSLEEQIENSMEFARKRFKAEKFIAYFQNATNTYAPAGELKKAYDRIKGFPDIIGLFISTRPDFIDEEKLDLIESYADKYEVWVEYGLQSVHNATLRRINRGHDFEQFGKAVENTSKRKIKIGAHVILGLPGETECDMMQTAEAIAKMPISGVKLHVLHVLKNTKLEQLFSEGEISLLGPSEYIKLVCDFLERLRPGCVILRLVSDARGDVLVAPQWINRKQEIIGGIKKEFQKRKTCQGSRYGKTHMRIR